MPRQVELSNIEIYEHCMLDIQTGHKEFYKKNKINKFTGLYFRDEHNFFAIYPSATGPIMYYEGREYTLKPSLHVHVKKMGDWREFRIEEYDICIPYRTSKYIGFDAWSEEEDVDLFYQIAQSYRDEAYYKKFSDI